MKKQENIEKLFSNMQNVLSKKTNHGFENDKTTYTYTFDQPGVEQYKSNQSWPGRKYSLIGNSFNLESKLLDTKSDTKRSACIAVVVEKGKDNCNCLSIEDALKFEGFAECLSRFEYDWLSKQPPSTLIGPAYDSNGELIANSFSVWRREPAKRKYKVKAEKTYLLLR